MTGTATNERPGVRAQHRFARVSAYKAREVLDLIRGRAVGEARDVLEFTERAVAADVAKVLESAVANAGNNHDIPPEELFVAACFADEGPTLRRYRPRARGRATRIRKRTCHITVIVGRYSPEEMEERRERASRSGAAPADARAARARRVARSRQRSGAEEAPAEEAPEETADTEVAAATTEAPGAEPTTDEAAADDQDAADPEAEVPAAEEAAAVADDEPGDDEPGDDESAEGDESEDA